MQEISDALPSDLFDKAFGPSTCKDAKLSEIGLYLKGLVHKQQPEAAQEEQKSAEETAKSQAEAAKLKKQQAMKKKMALMAKMKRKQSNFIKTDTPDMQQPTLAVAQSEVTPAIRNPLQ